MWELDCKESWAQKNWCFWTVMLQKTLESPLDWEEIKPVNPKGNQPWIFIGRTNAEAEAPILWSPDELTHWKRPQWWERLKAGEEGDDRGWDGWMVSLIQWKWVWASSRRWWRTGKPGMLQSTGSQRVRHDWATKQQPVPGGLRKEEMMEESHRMHRTQYCSPERWWCSVASVVSDSLWPYGL